jgi:hypothetical protein
MKLQREYYIYRCKYCRNEYKQRERSYFNDGHGYYFDVPDGWEYYLGKYICSKCNTVRNIIK